MLNSLGVKPRFITTANSFARHTAPSEKQSSASSYISFVSQYINIRLSDVSGEWVVMLYTCAVESLWNRQIINTSPFSETFQLLAGCYFTNMPYQGLFLRVSSRRALYLILRSRVLGILPPFLLQDFMTIRNWRVLSLINKTSDKDKLKGKSYQYTLALQEMFSVTYPHSKFALILFHQVMGVNVVYLVAQTACRRN